MNKFLKVFDKTISFILMGLVAFIAVGVTISVIERYFFSYSSQAFQELLAIAFAEVVIFGAAISIREKQHISISYFIDKNEKAKKIFDIVVNAIIAVVSAVLLCYSVKWIKAIGNIINPALGIRVGIYYVTFPITSGITVFYCMIEIIQHFVKIEEADKGYVTDDVLPDGEEARQWR